MANNYGPFAQRNPNQCVMDRGQVNANVPVSRRALDGQARVKVPMVVVDLTWGAQKYKKMDLESAIKMVRNWSKIEQKWVKRYLYMMQDTWGDRMRWTFVQLFRGFADPPPSDKEWERVRTLLQLSQNRIWESLAGVNSGDTHGAQMWANQAKRKFLQALEAYKKTHKKWTGFRSSVERSGAKVVFTMEATVFVLEIYISAGLSSMITKAGYAGVRAWALKGAASGLASLYTGTTKAKGNAEYLGDKPDVTMVLLSALTAGLGSAAGNALSDKVLAVLKGKLAAFLSKPEAIRAWLQRVDYPGMTKAETEAFVKFLHDLGKKYGPKKIDELVVKFFAKSAGKTAIKRAMREVLPANMSEQRKDKLIKEGPAAFSRNAGEAIFKEMLKEFISSLRK